MTESYMTDIILKISGAMLEKQNCYFEIHDSKIPFQKKIILE